MPRIVETYEQAIEYLYGRINYERVHSDSYCTNDFKLDRMSRLLSLLGNPQDRWPAVHVAGTKGKGSTAVMVAEMLHAAGYRVGLYTSPHIQAFEERMKVDGKSPSPEGLVDLVNMVAGPVAEMDRSPNWMKPTYFEIATAMACLLFEQRQTDLAVMEVGLGGRLDSTNLCRPEVSVITSISRDHTNLLGSDLAGIAREKAGIIRPEVPVVCGATIPEARQAIAEVCRQRRARLWQLGQHIHYQYSETAHMAEAGSTVLGAGTAQVDVTTPCRIWPAVRLALAGEHQAHNAAMALGAVDVLRERGWNVPEQAAYDGMAAVKWPVRIEVLAHRPTVIVDAAHNWASIAALLRTLERSYSARRKILVFATSKDKDVTGMLRQLVPSFDTVILSQYLNNPRAVPCEQLQRMVVAISEHPAHLTPDPATAWKLAQHLAQPDDLICVAGSFFIATEMRELIVDQGRDMGQSGDPASQLAASATGRKQDYGGAILSFPPEAPKTA